MESDIPPQLTIPHERWVDLQRTEPVRDACVGSTPRYVKVFDCWTCFSAQLWKGFGKQIHVKGMGLYIYPALTMMMPYPNK